MLKTLIVGATGQDGRLLNERLSAGGHMVNCSQRDFPLTDAVRVRELLSEKFDRIFYLAAVHGSSEAVPANSLQDYLPVNTHGPQLFMETISEMKLRSRLFFAGSSHMFGISDGKPLSEKSAMEPICFYGLSKLLTYKTAQFYRRTEGLHFSTGILFNHESALRKRSFLSRKVIEAAMAISRNRKDELVVGKLDQQVDWGYAPDYVEAMDLILSSEIADDFIISSGHLASVRDFVSCVFGYFGLDYTRHVREDSVLLGKTDRGVLFGDSSKLRKVTGWQPRHSFHEWVHLMCEAIQKGSSDG